MPELPEKDSPDHISGHSELNQVVIENSREPDECILFPETATDDELQTTWILAKEGSYLHPKDVK